MAASKIFLAVAGNIGTGKTTLAEMLSQRFGWAVHFESVSDNPYLEDFYADMKRWAFPLQVFFLNHRFRAHKLISSGTDSAIQDRSIYEDAHIFARNLYESQLMEKRDYLNYLDLYQEMTRYLTAPDLIIFLRKSLPVLQSQIKKRSRSYEAEIPAEYLLSLNQYYDEWMRDYDLGKKLVIESDGLDFVAHPEHFDWIAQQVMETLDQKDLFLGSPVGSFGLVHAEKKSSSPEGTLGASPQAL